MPQVEAACCGVPVAAVDYSAMEDVVRHTNGYPIRIKKMFRSSILTQKELTQTTITWQRYCNIIFLMMTTIEKRGLLRLGKEQ